MTLCLMAGSLTCHGQQMINGRKSLVFENSSARVVVDLSGGAIGDFRFKGEDTNPLNWATPKAGDTAVRGFGHFLCLDRWGPPSEAEGSRGMPYHGEAANVEWRLLRDATTRESFVEGEMAAKLPMAGLSIRRTVRMSATSPVFSIREEIKNEGALGRIYNAVQHPTVGPPFLTEDTLVDCNGRRGFAQGGTLPTPEEPSSFWPQALNLDGQAVNLRHLTSDPNPNVVSYAIDDSIGWVTAATPSLGLLIGYVWKTSDYPWVSLWRDVRDDKPAARGLEFGTTGLHQPFPILVKKGRIWDRQLFEHLDAGETISKSYTAFLLKIPKDFTGVGSIKAAGGRLLIRERTSGEGRLWSMDATGLLPD